MFRYVGEHLVKYRHDCGGNQHDHRARDHRRENLTQPGETSGQSELEDRRDDHEAGHERRATLHQGGGADGDECSGGTHHQDVAGADSPHPDCLENGSYPADEQSAKHRPCQTGLRLPSDAKYNKNAQDHSADDGE